jgi:uncharacterized protein (TIGR03435 family)
MDEEGTFTYRRVLPHLKPSGPERNNIGDLLLKASQFVLILLPMMIATPAVVLAQAAGQPAPAQASVPEPLSPMPTDASPSFDVATVKPSDSSAPHGTFLRTNGRHVIGFNISAEELIAYAYGLHAKQIVDGPASLLATHFDVDGVPDVEGHPNRKQSQLMFQKLLVSRFELAFHYETRELPAFAIQIAKGGPRLVPSTRKPSDSTDFTYNCEAVLTVQNASVADVAKGMQDIFLDKPVVDQTGLPGRYDFRLKWTPDELQNYCPRDPNRSREDSNAPLGLFTAIQEQLGLKLVSVKAPMQVMVIDRMEAPSEN